MATIDGGIQAETANDYITTFIQLILLLFILGTICRCTMICLKGLADGKDASEIIRILQARIFAAILAGCASGVLEIIKGAFKQ